MKLAIFGAAGKTGRLLVGQALAAGHVVRGLARDPAKVGIQHENLSIVTGNALDPAAVAETIRGSEVVLSALGIGAGNPPDAITRAVKNIVAAMQSQGQRRLIAISSIGIGDSYHQVPLRFKIVMKTIPILRTTMADIGHMEQFIRTTALDWIIVRPGGLEDGTARGRWSVSTPADKLSAGNLPRADVAAFMLAQLTADTWLGKTPGIT
ncbi:MAG: SDR family oxidoreductase [Gammaproteobacteria bacterium]|nr:SDR family oxidoreductase [Gammaproteobacteria bacterium]